VIQPQRYQEGCTVPLMSACGDAGAPVTGALRLLRAASFAASVLILALTAHVVGGAAAPSPMVIAAIAMLMLPVASLLAGRRRGLPALAGGLLAGQVVLHHVFMAFAASPVCRVLPGPTAPATGGAYLHDHARMTQAAFSSCASVAPAPSHDGGTSLWMVLAHGVAIAALAVLLTRGEQVLWLVADRLIPRLPAPVVLVRPCITRLAILARRVVAPRPPLLAGGTGRRGPPLAAGAPA
jgi:hypothetical protein